MSDKDFTMRVAMFRESKWDFRTTFHQHAGQNDENYHPPSGYVRVSDWVDVEFKPLTPEEVAGGELIALNQLRAETVNEFKRKLDDIDERMANLRALTGPEAV
jgi:hypothetical protein